LTVVTRAGDDNDDPEDSAMTNVQMWILIWQKAIVSKQSA
jgi:hypothetical protein